MELDPGVFDFPLIETAGGEDGPSGPRALRPSAMGGKDGDRHRNQKWSGQLFSYEAHRDISMRGCSVRKSQKFGVLYLAKVSVLRKRVSEQLGGTAGCGLPFRRSGHSLHVSGSMAMNYYAQPRMTRHIDLVVEISGKDAARIEKLFAKDIMWTYGSSKCYARRSMFNMIHLNHVVRWIAIVRKETEVSAAGILPPCAQVEIGGKMLPIVSAEDLLISKLEWARDSQI